MYRCRWTVATVNGDGVLFGRIGNTGDRDGIGDRITKDRGDKDIIPVLQRVTRQDMVAVIGGAAHTPCVRRDEPRWHIRGKSSDTIILWFQGWQITTCPIYQILYGLLSTCLIGIHRGKGGLDHQIDKQ